MADAAAILAANGMANAAVIVQAAVMEGTDLAVAATLVAGESWGKHIWGHDGVQTGGTYTKGGPVTQANYLAYRAQMRAGKIGRQGCGISQATSAQYQDTADQLGGCWDMLANARSGFRGAQALIRRYGLRDGMRRYNGSGPAAERYADNFMARYAIWRDRLAGATASSAPAPTPQEDDVPAPDVWNYPIPDPFTPQNDSMPAFAMLGWATTHAAVARGDAAAAKATAERCEAKLDQILKRLA